MQDNLEHITQELEKMKCGDKECTVEHDLNQYITIKSLIITGFALIAPLSALFMYIVNDGDGDTSQKIELKLLSMKEQNKRNELRIVRLENSQNEYKTTNSEILSLVRDIKNELKYTVVRKSDLKEQLDKKVDLDKINKQYLNK